MPGGITTGTYWSSVLIVDYNQEMGVVTPSMETLAYAKANAQT